MSSTLTATKPLSWHPTGADLRFVIKLVAGALLALFTAFIADLPQPHWAMMTALILFQPLAGMVLSRAAARLVGSLVGVSMGLLLVTLFAQAPPLLVAAASLWLGLCTFGAGMFAGNAGYVCVLAGYSAALVSFPGAQHPEQVFDMAWARCAEIGLGIICATLTQLSLWPRTASSALIPQAHETNEEAHSGAATALEAAEQSANPATCRAFNSVLSLNALLGHSRYELETGPAVRRSLRALLVNLLRLQAASRSAAGFWQRLPDTHPLQPLRQQAAATLRLPASAARRQRLARTANQLQQQAHSLADDGRPDDLNAYAALTRTAAALRYARDGDRLLRMAVRAPETNPAHTIEPPLANHRDPILAAFNGLRSSLTLGLVGSFWIVTGWSDGAGAAIIASIVCSMFASWPNPARAGGLFLWGIGGAVIAALLLHQWLLPTVNSFAMLALYLTPFLSAGALVMNRPSIAGAGVAFNMSLCTLLAPSNPMQYDLAALLNGFLANGFGAVVATLSYLVLAPPGVAWMRRRLHQQTRRDRSLLLQRRFKGTALAWFGGRLAERVNQILSPLKDSETAPAVVDAALSEFDHGVALLRLRRSIALPDQPLPARHLLLRSLATERRGNALDWNPVEQALRKQLSDASPEARRALLAALTEVTQLNVPAPEARLIA